MFCRNCGSTILEHSVVCLSCGVKAGTGNKFCPYCGAEPDPNAVICIKCGAALNRNVKSDYTTSTSGGVNDLGSAVKACFNKYATFSGRANRSEFWFFYLFMLIAMFVPFIGWVAQLAFFIPYISVTVRRLHDVGKSGWWIFISLIPLAGWIWGILLLCQASDEGENEYGANPNY